MIKPIAIVAATIATAAAAYLYFSKKKAADEKKAPMPHSDEKKVESIEKRIAALFKYIEVGGSNYGFKSEYNNGTGYFDPLVRVRPLPNLEVVDAPFPEGEIIRFGWMDSDSGRRVYVIDAPRDERFVLFRRYIGSETPIVIQTSHDVATSGNAEGSNLFNTRREGIEDVVTVLEQMLGIDAAR